MNAERARHLNELAAAAQGGDRAAMEAFLVAIAPSVERFGRRLCGATSPEIEDTLQDALLSIAQNLRAFEGRSSITSWVFTLVRTACNRRRRGLKNQPADALDEALPDTGPTPERETLQHEQREAVERGLGALSPEYREAVLLRDVEGLSAEEAADSLGIGVAALKSRLHRGRAALRERLAPTFAPSSVPASASCPDVVGALSSKLEDDLAPEACSLLEAHVAGCAACGSLCDTLKGGLRVCGELGREGQSHEREAELRRIVHAALGQLSA